MLAAYDVLPEFGRLGDGKTIVEEARSEKKGEEEKTRDWK
jgi:hypothetical protein